MRFTLRSKLLAIAATIALAFMLLIAAGAAIAARVTVELSRIQEGFLPKVELGPRLERDLDALTRGFQDAVAAKDTDALADTARLKSALRDELAGAGGAVDPHEADALRDELDDYYAAALDVSRRLIAGETGEPLVDAIAAMQSQQRHLGELVKAATTFDRNELTQAFAAAGRAQRSATQTGLLVSIACMLLVLALTAWVGRSTLAAVAQLSRGLERFGTGRFDEHIMATTNDELADVARHANQMADNLKAMAGERDRADWLKAGQTGLLQELRGDLTPTAAAGRACVYLSQYVGAAAAALYYADAAEDLALLGSFAAPALPRLRFGEGVIGQAALQTDVRVLRELPEEHVRRRLGLTQGAPVSVALVPLLHAGRVRGVLELASLKRWPENIRELLLSVRETLAIALEASLTRAQTQAQQHTLKERNKELEAARKRLEQQTHELASVSSYKSQFLANMSHELRTPLNSMLLLSNLLAENADGNLTPKQVESCQTIHSAGQDLLELINQVLDLARVESGKQALHLEQVPLRGVAERARRVFEPLAREKGVVFDAEVLGSAPEAIVSDRQRVDQIVTNLVGNAIKFTDHGRVTLQLDGHRRGGATLQVDDTGPGIAEQDRERIFAPFEQAGGRDSGTGLGLSIARDLAQLLGGDLALLRSEPGKGSTFVCHLPARAPAPDTRGAPAREPSRPSPPVRLNGKTVLIADDDERSVYALSAILEAKGARVLSASTGKAALALLDANPGTDAVLMDVTMPELDGYEATRRLRQDARFAALPVVALTAKAMKGDAERCFDAGATAYLPKPVSADRLLPLLHALLKAGVHVTRR